MLVVGQLSSFASRGTSDARLDKDEDLDRLSRVDPRFLESPDISVLGGIVPAFPTIGRRNDGPAGGDDFGS